jgi:riboflavin kinase
MVPKINKNCIILMGKVKAGLGKGRYFMSQKGYKTQFIRKLGINPYHGTLNVALSGRNLEKMAKIRDMDGIKIKGFRSGGKNFGEVIAYNARISSAECALVIPKRSIHKEIAEIVSSSHLRSKLHLSEGSSVKITILV